MYAAFAWEHEVGSNFMKEFWDATKDFAYQVIVDENFIEGDVEKREAADEIVMELSALKKDGFVKMTRGCETRWWTIGQAALILFNSLNTRIFMAKNYLSNNKPTDKVKQTIQTFLSLAAEPSIINDLALLKSFHQYYVAPHMKVSRSGLKL